MLREGEIVGGRFALGRSIGAGGMAEIFQAEDRAAGGVVAIKLLRSGSPHDVARFEREARVLSELAHPGIVRYVAHGVAARGEPFLAMEWLEGEDLHARLQRGRLTVVESTAMLERVADVLAVVHAQGVVHRDLKPSNIFLVRGSVEQVKVLDFGIARLEGATALTRSATTIGTPGYMAPEQARGEPTIDARADVFSLGSVLFECLTGVAAFSGPNAVVILAKILLDEVPLVTDLYPEAPPDLAALCARMLAKNPAERPRNGAAVAAALPTIAAAIARGEQAATGPVAALTGGERKLVSVVLVSPERGVPGGGPATLAQTGAFLRSDAIRGVVLDHGGRLEVLADGSAVVMITGARDATDQAARAARCALSLRELSEGRPVAVATGSGDLSGKAPISDVIERAGVLLAARELRPADPGGPPGAPPIVVDDVTAGLLDGRFEVRAREPSFELHGERTDQMASRTLLGRPTACVGRERELAALEALLDECLEEPVAQAVVITAPPGIGKSRLANELVRSLRSRREPIEVWIGRGGSLRAGSSLGMLRRALETAIGIQGGEPQEERQNKLRARVERHVEPAAQQRVTEFLGEVLGAALLDEGSAPLRAARLDGQLMSDQMRRAWEDFCAAECAAHPVLLVLEDLHWGDLGTVRFVDAALKRLPKRPFMVLALARPEVHELFPSLWADRGAQHIRLKALSQRASEQLVRQVLGGDADPEIVQRIAVTADGNAFFLEELIRAAAEGKQAALPGTIVAVMQARLEGLEGEARRVLRAASVFGEVLWRGGVEALLPGLAVAAWLPALVERELLVRRRESRFPGEEELSFRHALLREAAYAMLTPADRETGHRLAAEWLEQHGEQDPLMLAEHFERGRLPARAGLYYARAAEQAIRGADPEGTIARAERGLERGVTDDVRVTLLKLLCEGHGWRSEHSLAVPYADEALRLTHPGSEAWACAMVVKLGHATMTGHVDELLALVGSMRGITPAPSAVGLVSFSFACAVYWFDLMGRPDLALICLAQVSEIAEPIAAREPSVRGWLNTCKVLHLLFTGEDPWVALRAAELGWASFLEIGHGPQVKAAQAYFAITAWTLGAFDLAERELREALSGLDTPYPTSLMAMVCLIELLADRGAFDEAEAQANRALKLARASPMPSDEGRARWGMAIVLLRRGDFVAAEREALAALERLAILPLEHAAVTTTLAVIRLAQGRAAEALAALQKVTPTFRAALARLVHAEALHATGDLDGARVAIAAARARVLAVAASIEDPSYRRSYVERVPEVVRTLELARRWIDAAAAAR